MAKKSKSRQGAAQASAPKKTATAKKRMAKPAGIKKSDAAKKGLAAKKGVGVKKVLNASKGAGVKKGAASGKKRAATHLKLPLPLARARKLSGDLYQSASLALWTDAIEGAPDHERATLIQLQDAICDAADLLKQAKATNPQHLRIYWVAGFDGDDLPATPPRFVAARSAEEALEVWRATVKDEPGRGAPQARLVPELGETPGLLE